MQIWLTRMQEMFYLQWLSLITSHMVSRPHFENVYLKPWYNYVGPLLLTWLILIPAWIGNYIHYEVWDEITYPFLNFNGATIEV